MITKKILNDLDSLNCVIPSSYNEVSLIFVDDKQIQDLNKQYRNKDKATDVLTFVYWQEQDDSLIFLEQSDALTAGEIIISLDTANKQGEELNISLQERVFDLLLHGLLHLYGYDHIQEQDAKEMFALQDKLYKQYISCWRMEK